MPSNGLIGRTMQGLAIWPPPKEGDPNGHLTDSVAAGLMARLRSPRTANPQGHGWRSIDRAHSRAAFARSFDTLQRSSVRGSVRKNSRSVRGSILSSFASSVIVIRFIRSSHSRVTFGERAAARPPLTERYDSFGASVAVCCFAKCSRAATTASGVIAHDVFFTSFERVNVARRYARSRFGSIPRSFARTFGVTFLLMSLLIRITSFRLRMHIIANAHTNGCKHIVRIVRVRCILRSLRRSIVASFDRSNVRSLSRATTTPPRGDRWGICNGLVKNPPRPYGAELFSHSTVRR